MRFDIEMAEAASVEMLQRRSNLTEEVRNSIDIQRTLNADFVLQRWPVEQFKYDPGLRCVIWFEKIVYPRHIRVRQKCHRPRLMAEA